MSNSSKTISLLQELEALDKRDIKHIIESRGHNIIVSAINLLSLIEKQYPAEHAQLLERRLLSAIKNRDQHKFSKSVRKKDEGQ